MHGLKDRLPEHVAIVMDGNGRWAESRGLSRVDGHCAGVDAVKSVIRCCLERQIPVLSLFAFSSENWSRPEDEVEFLMDLFVKALGQEVKELHRYEVCLAFPGDKSALSERLQQKMAAAEKLTGNNKRLTLNVVVNYGGKWDIVQATRNIATKMLAGEIVLDGINEELISQELSTAALPDPDLFIRTSGEQRISNFFLWQLAYTELYFADVHWPDFTASEFEKALQSFAIRERRYGKTAKQLLKE